MIADISSRTVIPACLGLSMACAMPLLADTPQQLAKQIVETSGVRGGLIVHLDADDPETTIGLRQNERYVVQALVRDPRRLDGFRAAIKAKDVYGPVSADALRGSQLPYSDNLANLVVVESVNTAVPESEIMRVLAPGGTLQTVKAGIPDRTVIKPWPEDIDSWSHYLHGPGNNAVAADRQVGPPQHMAWKSGPMWCRSHEFASSISCLVSDNGRIFVVQDEGVIGQPRGVPSRWNLVARDAFNGLLLWKLPVSNGQKLQRCVVAAGDRLIAPLGAGAPVSVLDAATGDELKQFADSATTSEMVVCDGAVTLALSESNNSRKLSASGNVIALFDVRTGELRWRVPVTTVHRESLAADDGRVFFHDGKAAVALAMSDGKEVWCAPCGPGKHLIVVDGTVVVSSSGGIRAFDAADGRPLWTGPSSGQDLFVVQGRVWVDSTQSMGRNVAWTTTPFEAVGLDVITGKPTGSVRVENLLSPGHHARCYRAKATERYILQRKRGIEFIDLEGDNHMRHDWVRAPCRHGFVPANGLLYMPPNQCFCYPGARLTGFNVLSARISPQANRPVPDNQRLTRGPGAAPTGVPQSAVDNASDWPTFRHDAKRSGSVQTSLPADLAQIWSSGPGTDITPPVVSNGRLFVAAKSEHAVYCMDAATGEALWHYTAGGRIDSPPTIHNGLVLFGCTNGRVYCLRADDGMLVWRFLAAPDRRQIMAFDQLESPWPVHGSVLVQNGLVYASAGRSSYLDGGIRAYALSPETGEMVYSTTIDTPSPDLSTDPGRPFDMDGTRTDVLVSDGVDLYLFRERLTPDLTRVATPRLTRMGDRRYGLHLMCTDGFLDDNWFNRTFWTYSQHWPGFYFGYRSPKSGQILVFDDEAVFALKVFTQRRSHSPEYQIGSGYELVADRVDNEPFLSPHAIGRDKSEGFTRSAPPLWSTRVPTRAVAMVLAGDKLCLAGPPDLAPEDDPMSAWDGHLGAELRIFAAVDGTQQAEHKLDVVPVSDGMIAANKRLYISTRDGHVVCLGADK